MSHHLLTAAVALGGSASIFARRVRICPAIDSISRWNYAEALYKDTGATLDDLRESVETLEDLERTARRVLGTAHPLAAGIEAKLRDARAALHARETQDAFRTARTKLAQERADAEASARPSGDAA